MGEPPQRDPPRLMDVSGGAPVPFPEDGEIARAIADASVRLRAVGREMSVSVEELKWWFAAPTVHPQRGLAKMIEIPWLVVHELVEIDEWKRRGGRPQGTVPDREIECPEEHLIATEVELRLAAAEGDAAHLRSRIEDVAYWLVDTLTPLVGDDRTRCERLLEDARAALTRLEGGGS